MDWQPIETAPKDGTRLIAWGVAYGNYGYTEDEWTEALIRWVGGAWMSTAGGGRHGGGFRPTHWMPLPPPPTTG